MGNGERNVIFDSTDVLLRSNHRSLLIEEACHGNHAETA